MSHTLLQWWQADALGIVLVTPLTLAWRNFPQDWFSRERIIETVLCFGLAFLVGQIIFLDWAHYPFGRFVKDYWMFPFVAWAAVRFGLRGTLLVISVTALQILLGQTQETMWITESFAKGLKLNFWLYTFALLLIGLSIAIFLEKKKTAELELRQNRDLFNKLSQRVPGIIYQFKLFPDGRTCFPFASEGMKDVFGISPEELQVDASGTFTKVLPEDYAGLMASIEESARTLTQWQHAFRVSVARAWRALDVG